MINEDILTLMSQSYNAIEKTQDSVSIACKIFDTEEIIGIHQCASVISAIGQMIELTKELYKCLENLSHVPYGRLFIELYHLQKQAEALRSDMSSFRLLVVTVSPQEMIKQRLMIRKQLISFDEQLNIVCSTLVEGAYHLAVLRNNDKVTISTISSIRDQNEARRHKEVKICFLEKIKMILELNLLSIKERQALQIDPRNVSPDLEVAAELTQAKIERVKLELAELLKESL